jgi:hypothetical protein
MAIEPPKSSWEIGSQLRNRGRGALSEYIETTEKSQRFKELRRNAAEMRPTLATNSSANLQFPNPLLAK